MPLNVLDANYRSFQKEVLPVLDERARSASIGMKSLSGNGSIVTKAGIPIDQALGLCLLAADLDPGLRHRLREESSIRTSRSSATTRR